MLRTTTKKAKENIKKYIVDNFDCSDYTDNALTEWPSIAEFIIATFREEKPPIGAYARMTEQERFSDWASGLPSVLDCCYYYNRSAVDDLAEILEETEEEKSKFTEQQAERQLTWLIYRELLSATR